MAIEQQGWSVSRSRQSGDEIGPGWITGHDACVNSRILEKPIKVRDAGSFIARWIGCIKSKQCLEEFGGMLMQHDLVVDG
jgi:hypothetical protein